MPNELLEKPVEYEVNGETVKLSGSIIKQYLTSGSGKVSDQEVVMFLNLCRFQHLNPFLNEAYLVKFGTAPASIIVSKEAFMKRAENNPHYRGFKAGVIVQRGDEIVSLTGAVKLPNDVLIGGWAEVKRDDRDEPTRIEISFNEFSKSQATWKSMPLNMIRKSAIVNALREAFPESLGAMYTEDDKQPIENQAPVKDVSPKEDKLNSLLTSNAKTEPETPKTVTPEPQPEVIEKTETKTQAEEVAADGNDEEIEQGDLLFDRFPENAEIDSE